MQHFSPIKQRILEYLEFKGISKYQFYKDSGITRSVLDKSSGISEENIAKFIAYDENVNINWLITGFGKMEVNSSTDNSNEITSVYKLRTDRNHENQIIPLYNLEATAGLVDLFQNQGDQTPIDTIRIPNLPKCDGAVFVTGDSMYPLLKSGDIVAYKQIYDFGTEIFWGEMYLISVEVAGEEFVSVKYIQKSDKGEKYVKLVSQNQHHQPKDVPLEKVRALALIKASIRINSMR